MKGLKKLTKQLEELPETIEDAGEDSIEDELGTVKDRAQRNLRQNDTNWTRELSTSATIFYRENGYSLRFTAGHGPYVEYGTGGYFGTSVYPIPSDVEAFPAPGGVTEDMVENIEQWIDDKGIVGEHYSNDRDLAEAISHTIAALGTRAHPFLRPAWYGYRERLINNAHRDIKRKVRRI